MATETQSNVNAALVNNYGNTGNISQNVEPASPKAIILVPNGTIIPAADFVNQATLLTYINTASAQGTIADTRTNRWFALLGLDDFKDATKGFNTVDTGLNQFDITKFNTKFTFRYLSNKQNHQELLKFSNTNAYSAYIVDSAGNLWGRIDPTGAGGLAPFSIQQLFIMDWMAADVKDFNQYRFAVQFKNRTQFNENFGIYQAGIDSDSLVGLENAVAMDISAVAGTPLSIITTTDVVLTLKAGNGSQDLGLAYQGSFTAACFVATDLTSGTVLTAALIHGQGTIIVGGITYNYIWLRHGTAPTATHVVQYTLAAPSVVNAVIPNFNAVTEITQSGVNGSNAAVHTF